MFARKELDGKTLLLLLLLLLLLSLSSSPSSSSLSPLCRVFIHIFLKQTIYLGNTLLLLLLLLLNCSFRKLVTNLLET
jgi:hypothetical protein